MSKKKHKKKNSPKKETKITEVKEEITSAETFEDAKEEAEVPTLRADTLKTEENNGFNITVIDETPIPYDPKFTTEDFSASVTDISEKDIQIPEEIKEELDKKKKMSAAENAVQLSMLFVLGAVIVVCLFLLGENIWGKIKGQQIFENTVFEGFIIEGGDAASRELAYTYSDKPPLTLYDRILADDSAVEENNSGQYDQQLSQMKASLSALKAQYKDIYGWIYVPGTNINHPIMRSEDNIFYLDHAHTGEYLPIGAIFADYTTLDSITDNYNTVLYGHNVMSTGQSSMFHDVEKFLKEDFFNSNNIYIYTMEGAYIFKPFAIYPTVSDDFYFRTGFQNGSQLVDFAREKLSKSTIPCKETFAENDKILTLSTCTNGASNGRYALHAKLIEIIK